MTIGDRISKLRTAKNFSREALAGKINVSTKTIENYEGNVYEPKAAEILNLAVVLGTTAAYLLGEIEDPLPDALNLIKYPDKKLEELGYQERSADGDLADPAKMEAMHLALLREYEAAKRLREYIQRQPQRPTPKKDGG